jgi:hypothetical protein
VNLLPFGVLLTMYAWGADAPPEFTAAGVVRGARAAKILVPGVGMSIYGQHLGPAGSGCSGAADPQRRETPNPRRPDRRFEDTSIYPTELCGVQVFIGDKAAGLLYVSEKLIHLKIPQDSPESGSVDIRVVYMGQSSPPVTLAAGFEKTTVSLEQPAYTDMPVWLKANLPLDSGTIQYPYVLGPAGFGCNEVEVRRDGKLLAVQPGSNWMRYGMAFSGNICGSYSAALPSKYIGRLPLHLLYRFDAPGTYEVRLTVWGSPAGFGPQGDFRARSEWTLIEVLPSKPKQRAEWLEALRARAPADAAEVLTDTLPSLLGAPDDASFDILAGYLYHPDLSVRRCAMNGLSYWPEDLASGRLLSLLGTKGPSDSLIGFLTRQPRFRDSAGIVDASLPFLESDSPVLMGGAVDALRLASRDNPAIRETLLRSAEHVVSRAGSQTGSDVAQMLAAGKDPRAHALLQSLLEKGHSQVASGLLSFGDPADLPGLSALLTDLAGGPLADDLYRVYGDAAIPYLKRALTGSPERFTAQHIARRLIAIGDPAGFQYAVRAIEQKGIPRIDIIQILKSQFPELNSASEEAIVAFARTRAGSAQ